MAERRHALPTAVLATAVLTILVTLTLSASAAAATRYASPSGTNLDPSCPLTEPCSIDGAVEHPSVDDGDTVQVLAGTHTTDGLEIVRAITIVGPVGSPVTIESTGMGIDAITAGAITLSDLRIDATSNWALRLGVGSSVRRTEALTDAGTGCIVWGDAALEDTVCATAAGQGYGIEASPSASGGAATLALTNVTAVGHFVGLGVTRSTGSPRITVSASNTIARGGTGADVSASNNEGADGADVALTGSSYATVSETGGATITPPGQGANQVAEPAFVDAASQDFRQRPTSPTINAGVNQGDESGRLDFHGDSRLNESIVDIGADEGDAEPTITITDGPAEGSFIKDATPSFAFTADESAGFACSIAPASQGLVIFLPCSSPFTLVELADGEWTFRVRATDSAGNAPLVARSFTIDTAPPETAIDSGPAPASSDATPSFAFSSDEPGASFHCRIDGGAWIHCVSPHVTASLPDGQHSFEARAVDRAGNIDSSPAAHPFAVDTTEEDPVVDTPEDDPVADTGEDHPVVDTTAPETVLDTVLAGARIKGRKLQRLRGKRIRVVVKAGAGEDVSGIARGAIVAVAKGKGKGNRAKRFRLRPVRRASAAGKRVAYRLTPRSRGHSRKILRLLRRGWKLRARVKVRLTDAVGNTMTLKRGVRLRRAAKRRPAK